MTAMTGAHRFGLVAAPVRPKAVRPRHYTGRRRIVEPPSDRLYSTFELVVAGVVGGIALGLLAFGITLPMVM
jgi:hypothetical protein